MNAVTPLAASIDAHDGATLATRLARKYADRITGSFVLPATAGRYAAFPPDLPEGLVRAFRSRGIERLYSHQAAVMLFSSRWTKPPVQGRGAPMGDEENDSDKLILAKMPGIAFTRRMALTRTTPGAPGRRRRKTRAARRHLPHRRCST